MQSFLEQLAVTLNLPGGSLSAETRLEDIPNWDSLAVLTTLALIDEVFEVQMSGQVLSACDTLDDLCKAIEELNTIQDGK
jgi:acyl carrier protein